MIGVVGSVAEAAGTPVPVGHASGWPLALKPELSMK
jgi:hypothetical protein